MFHFNILLAALILGLGSDDFQTRETCSKILTNWNIEYDLRQQIPTWHEDIEVRRRLQSIHDSYKRFSGPVPELKFFIKEDQAVGCVHFIDDDALQIALDMGLVSSCQTEGHYLHWADKLKWIEATNRYLDIVFSKRTRKEVLDLIDAARQKSMN